MAGRRAVLAATVTLILTVACGGGASELDPSASHRDPEEAAAIEAATNAAGEFFTGEPERVEARRMTFGQAKAELADWGGGEPASVVGTPPPSQPVWFVKLTGVGVPPGPPAGDPRPETCLEIIVVLNTSPPEDIRGRGAALGRVLTDAGANTVPPQQLDFIANWIGMTKDVLPFEWAQTGFTEGNYRTVIGGQHQKYTLSSGPRVTATASQRGAHLPGTPATTGGVVYIWQFGRGPSFATIDVGFMLASSTRFDAVTEHFDNTHMEPNGVQCFATNASCLWSPGYDLWLWSQSGYWYTWGWTSESPTTLVESGGYDHVVIKNWYSFKTLGIW